MIAECMNPECRRELRYLRDGKVVRVVRQQQDRVRVEHFWLCGECRLDYDFHFSGDDQVSMTRRRDSIGGPNSALDLTFVA